MTVFSSAIQVNSEEYKANVTAMKAVVDDLHRVSDEIEQGGEIQAREKHIGRGKLLPRERIRRIGSNQVGRAGRNRPPPGVRRIPD